MGNTTKGGVNMTGYMLVWLLLQEIDRLHKELQSYKDQENKN